MKPNKGDFIKAVGANWGAVWNGHRWERFECFGCAIASKLITGRRLNNGDHTRVKIGPGARLNSPHLHDSEIHNKWLADGKPSPLNK